MAALKIDSSVVTWGIAGCGGDSSSVATQVADGVEQVAVACHAMAALKSDGPRSAKKVLAGDIVGTCR